MSDKRGLSTATRILLVIVLSVAAIVGIRATGYAYEQFRENTLSEGYTRGAKHIEIYYKYRHELPNDAWLAKARRFDQPWDDARWIDMVESSSSNIAMLNSTPSPRLPVTATTPAQPYIPPPPPPPQAFVQALTQPAFIVQPGQLTYYKFIIAEDWQSVIIKGRFRASGGSGNDIDVFITNEDGLTNYRNGHAATSWYTSGKVTTDTLNVALSAGTYYLVFSNTFSSVSNKAINTDIKLTYEK